MAAARPPYEPGLTRRAFLRLAAGAAAGLPVLGAGCTVAGRAGTPGGDPWATAAQILARIRPPVFPDRTFDATRFDAAGDGATDCTEAFARAIAACHEAGGGRVVVPAGDYRTGPIVLRSNVELHVSEGATLRFHREPERYLPAVFTRWEGVELMNYAPLVYAFEAENVAVTGRGTLDGQADCAHWWPWKGRTECGWRQGDPRQDAARARLFEMAERGVPVAERVFGDGDYLRPQFIQPYRCTNILIEGVTITNSPMWEIHPVPCTNVIVRGVRVVSHGPNNDGCNPESCRDVLIEDCYFDTGDDCIALKSGRNADGRRLGVPIENVVVRGCQMKDGHGGVVIGSEISGGARYIFAERCRMDSPNLDRALRIKTNAVRGGVVEHVYLRDIEVGQVSDAAIWIDFFYEEGDAGPHRPVVRDIEVRRLTCRQSERALYLRGYADAPIRDLHLADCTFDRTEEENVVEHVVGLTFDDVRLNGEPFGLKG